MSAAVPCKAGAGYVHFDGMEAKCVICHPELKQPERLPHRIQQRIDDLENALAHAEGRLGAMAVAAAAGKFNGLPKDWTQHAVTVWKAVVKKMNGYETALKEIQCQLEAASKHGYSVLEPPLIKLIADALK